MKVSPEAFIAHFRRHQDATGAKFDELRESLRRRVSEADNGCWVWTGPTSPSGYAIMRSRRLDEQRAHRISYRLHVGDIPDGMVVDHLCRHTSCVNPAHLEVVTQRENVRRGFHDRGYRAPVFISPSGLIRVRVRPSLRQAEVSTRPRLGATWSPWRDMEPGP